MQCDASGGEAARFARIAGPIEANRVAAALHHRREPPRAAFGKKNSRHLLEPAENLSAIGERESLVFVVGEDSAPGIEKHHDLRAGFDLRIEVIGDRARVHLEDPVQQSRPPVQHRLQRAPVGAARAFDHIAGERERAPRKADERHAPGERAAHFAHRIEHVAQIIQIGWREPADLRLVAERPLETRTFAFGEREPEPHGVGDGEDVRENNRRVERKALERLQRHFRSERGRLRQREKASGARARGVVLRQVAPGLAHQPDRRVLGRLAGERAQQRIVLQISFVLM